MGSELNRLRAVRKLFSSASDLLPADRSSFMVHGRGEITTSEPRRLISKLGFAGAGGFDSFAAVFGDGSGSGAGNTVGRNSFNGVSNLVASSAEANSITKIASGRFFLKGHMATSRREPMIWSACALSHFTTDLNSLGGPESLSIGSSRSLSALERINCPASLTSP